MTIGEPFTHFTPSVAVESAVNNWVLVPTASLVGTVAVRVIKSPLADMVAAKTLAASVHARPVAVDESEFNIWVLVPTASLVGIVAEREIKSPLACKTVETLDASDWDSTVIFYRHR